MNVLRAGTGVAFLALGVGIVTWSLGGAVAAFLNGGFWLGWAWGSMLEKRAGAA